MAVEPAQKYSRRAGTVARVLGLLAWGLAAFGSTWFARDLGQLVLGWPLNFWLAAQGALLAFIAIVALYAAWRNGQGDEPGDTDAL